MKKKPVILEVRETFREIKNFNLSKYEGKSKLMIDKQNKFMIVFQRCIIFTRNTFLLNFGKNQHLHFMKDTTFINVK